MEHLFHQPFLKSKKFFKRPPQKSINLFPTPDFKKSLVSGTVMSTLCQSEMIVYHNIKDHTTPGPNSS